MIKAELRRTRLDMASYLQEKMRTGYERYLDEQKLEWEGGLLKTYLVEADVITRPSDSHNQIFSFLQKQTAALNYTAEQLDEENFFALIARSRVSRQAKSDIFYIDASDYRFWITYSIGHSSRTDRFIDKFVSHSPKLDNAWFPMQFLSKLADTKGIFTGLGGRFNNSPFTKDEEEQLRISLKLWGNLAKDVFDAFQKSDMLKRAFSLSNVRLKRYLQNTDESVTDDINYSGKITSMGQSFDSHLDLVNSIYREEYRNTLVGIIEKELAIGFDTDSSGGFLKGEPIFVSFQKTIPNVEKFVKDLFSGTSPFRLWGLQEMVKKDFARIYAVDMHLGRPLTFEVFPDTIRIFLHSGTCGNSIIRFFTLFQHHYDSSAELSGGKHDHLF